MTASSFDEVGNGQFLKAKEFVGTKVYTIKDVTKQELTDLNDKVETKLVVSFEEVSQGITLNVTRKVQMKELFGTPQNSIGKKVELFTVQTAKGPSFQFRAPSAQTNPATKIVQEFARIGFDRNQAKALLKQRFDKEKVADLTAEEMATLLPSLEQTKSADDNF